MKPIDTLRFESSLPLNTLETKGGIEKFNCQQLQCSHWCETSPAEKKEEKIHPKLSDCVRSS